MTEPKPHTQIVSLPIFWQVLGLCLCVLILALGINTLVVLKAPEPPPSGYSLNETVQAFKAGQVRLPNGHVLKSTVSPEAPAFVTTPTRSGMRHDFQLMIAARLAAALNVPADTVWVNFERPRGFHSAYGDHGDAGHPPGGPGPYPASGPPPPGPNSQQPGGPQPGGFGPEGPPHFEHSHFEQNTGRPRLPPGAESPSEIVYPAFSAAWQQKDGSYRVIRAPHDLIQPWQIKLVLGFGLTTLAILPLVYLLSQRLTRPIIAFSEAAAKIGVEDDAPPILSAGPREVRAAADVVNAMQGRIRKQVESRTALMAAIAHDLKTPLARMRLRIEDLPAPMRDKLSGDIAHMDDLIRSAMSFTSAHKMSESLRPLDLSALADSLCEDLSPLCQLEPSRIAANIRVKGDAVALKRILTNLIENAGRYAGACRIELSANGKCAELRIIDTGPGLPEEALESVFEPFYRLESSRNRDTGGTGLGLSVARALAEAQGGSLTLTNHYRDAKITGLVALLSLPLL